MHGRQRTDKLIGALAISVLLEPERDVLIMLVELHDALPIPYGEALRALTRRDAGLNRLLKRRHRYVAHLREPARGPRLRDIAEVALARGRVVVSARPDQGERAYGERDGPRARTRGLVQRILHVELVSVRVTVRLDNGRSSARKEYGMRNAEKPMPSAFRVPHSDVTP